jgi:hypothetical protein
MRRGFHFGNRVGHGNRPPDDPHGHDVLEVVTHERGLFRRGPVFGRDSAHVLVLPRGAEHSAHVEFAGPPGGGGVLPGRQKNDGHSGDRGQSDADTVVGVKSPEILRGAEKYPAVGERSVDVQE